MNVALVPHIQQSIRDDPEFDMGAWAHCIAAHTVKAAKKQKVQVPDVPEANVALYAMRALGIGSEEASRLFFRGNWPATYSSASYGGADAAISLLDHVAQVGQVEDWRSLSFLSFSQTPYRTIPAAQPVAAAQPEEERELTCV